MRGDGGAINLEVLLCMGHLVSASRIAAASKFCDESCNSSKYVVTVERKLERGEARSALTSELDISIRGSCLYKMSCFYFSFRKRRAITRDVSHRLGSRILSSQLVRKRIKILVRHSSKQRTQSLSFVDRQTSTGRKDDTRDDTTPSPVLRPSTSSREPKALIYYLPCALWNPFHSIAPAVSG